MNALLLLMLFLPLAAAFILLAGRGLFGQDGARKFALLASTGTLVEAKGTVERNAIRLAIGQLADYKRFVDDGAPKHLAVLVPSEPREDLRKLLAGEGIEVIYPEGSTFKDSTGGSLLQ